MATFEFVTRDTYPMSACDPPNEPPSHWICADCEAPSSDGAVPCSRCMSLRVVLRSMFERLVKYG